MKYLCYITVEDKKLKDRESTSTQNDDQQSNSGAHPRYTSYTIQSHTYNHIIKHGSA